MLYEYKLFLVNASLGFCWLCFIKLMKPINLTGKPGCISQNKTCWTLSTVDGRNPAPPNMYDETLQIMGNLPYQLVNACFWTINSRKNLPANSHPLTYNEGWIPSIWPSRLLVFQYTARKTNMTMENQPFEDMSPILFKMVNFPLPC